MKGSPLQYALVLTPVLAALPDPVRAGADVPRCLSRDDYTDRVRAMWMAEVIGNWTGRITEGVRIQPPFFTDADWGTAQGGGGATIGFILDQDPWLADDDTDIEYVYVHLMDALGRNLLTPADISSGWIAHVNRAIWVSNAEARSLMDRGVSPPSTGISFANRFFLRIDAQLTTEVFGAIAPGMTGRALLLADAPIRNVADSYAVHAAQFFVDLYAQALLADPATGPAPQLALMLERARSRVPDGSKVADLYDYVLADFLDNPDPTDWERTRDRVHQRYRLMQPDPWHGFPDPLTLGFKDRKWTGSDVNFANTIICILYSAGDLARAIQIGTLAGWDSDNPTATVAGLYGLMLGTQGVANSFPGASLSDRFDIDVTRDNLPDRLPADPDAQDTFTMLSQRMASLARREVIDAGGLVDDATGRWLLPPVHDASPTADLWQRSANNQVRLAGGTVTPGVSHTSSPASGFGCSGAWRFCSGAGADFSGAAPALGNVARCAYSTQGSGAAPGANHWISVTYSTPVMAHTVRFIEGDHYPAGTAPFEGGWFQGISLQVLVGGAWTDPAALGSTSVTSGIVPDPQVPFEIIDIPLEPPLLVEGVRISGPAGGADAFITASSLDVFAPPLPPPPLAFDLNADGARNIEDLFTWHAAPADLDGSGTPDAADARYLRQALRWGETGDTNLR